MQPTGILKKKYINFDSEMLSLHTEDMHSKALL